MSKTVKTRKEVAKQCGIGPKQILDYQLNMKMNQCITLSKIKNGVMMYNNSLGEKTVYVIYKNETQYSSNKNRTKEYCFDDGGWEVYKPAECILVEWFIRIFMMHSLNSSKKSILAGF